MSIIGYDKFGRPVLNGGKGSGNFGHSGRPGLQGGSAGAGSSRGSKTSTSKASKKSKSAKDLYKEKYEKDYQGDEIPDKPIDQITDKDIEHLDTQVRERLMKEKRKATGKQTYADAEKDYYDKIDETDYYDLDDTLYGLEDPAADELRYSLLSLTSQYSSLVHGAVNTEDIKEYEKGIKEAIKDSEKYADQLKEKDLKKRAKKLIDYIKDAPTRFEEDNSLLNQRLNKLTKIVNGGKGSGNFGHSGRPGIQGGSAGEGTSRGSSGKSQETKKKSKKASSKKSAKDWYKEKYPGDYQGDEVPDKPIEQLTDKDTEHLDTQVRERIAKEKKRAELDTEHKKSGSATMSKEKARADLDDIASDVMGGDMSDFSESFASQLENVYASGVMTKKQAEKAMIGPDEGKELKLKGKDGSTIIVGDGYIHVEKKKENYLNYDNLGRLISNGGKGSGNFGHSGRPGLQGGSAGEGTSHSSTTSTSKSTTLSGEERYDLSEKADTNISKLSKATTTASKLSKKNDEIIAKANKSYEAQEKAFDEFYEKYKDDENYDDLYYERYDDGRHPKDFKAGLDNYKKFTREVSDLKTKIEKSHSNYSKEQEKEFSWVGSDTEEEKAYDKHLKSLADDSEYSVKYYKDDVDRLIKKYDSEEQKVGGVSAYNFAKEFANQDIVKELKKIQKELK